MTRFGCFVDLPCLGKYPAEPTMKCIAVASFRFLPRTLKAQWLGPLLRVNSAASHRL